MRNAILICLLVPAMAAIGADGVLKPVARPPDGQAGPTPVVSVEYTKPVPGAGTVNPKAMVARVRKGAMTVALAFDTAKPETAKPDLVRIDCSGTGRFTDAPTVPLTTEPTKAGSYAVKFGPATVEIQRAGRTVPVNVEGYYRKIRNGTRSVRQLDVDLRTGAEGTCRFGARSYAVRLVDGNGNLTLTDAPQALRRGEAVYGVREGDTVLIDPSGDGFDGKKVIRACMGQPVLVDGKFYDLTISADGGKITAAPSKAEPATLHIPNKNWRLQLVGEKYILSLRGSTDPFVVPADKYAIAAYSETTPAGTLTISPTALARGMAKKIDAAADATTKVAIGSPLKASMTQAVSGKTVRMGFVLTDCAGLPVVVDLKAGRPAPPGVEVYDADGKRIYSGKFAYG